MLSRIKWFQGVRQHLKSNLLLLVGLLFLTACQTTPDKRQVLNQQGTWNTVVYYKDLVKKKSATVRVKFRAFQRDKLRVDVSSSLVGHLSTLLMLPNQAQLLMVKDRKYYYGASDRRLIGKILGLDIEPTALYDVLYETQVSNKNWSCSEFGERKFSCKSLMTGTQINWFIKDGKRLVEIKHKKSFLKISFLNYQNEIRQSEKAFRLKVPKKFKRYKLR